MQRDRMVKTCSTCGKESEESICPRCEILLLSVDNLPSSITEQPVSVAKQAVIPSSPVPQTTTPSISNSKIVVNPPMPVPGRKMLVSIVLVAIVIIIVFSHPYLIGGVLVDSPQGLGEMRAPNGETIGVNDGSFAPFDTYRNPQEVNLKQQAAQALRAGNGARAESLWQQALGIDSSDAEALIYLENQRAMESGKHYVTLVACVAFVNGDTSSQSQLQGIYVAQREHNVPSSAYDLRILIANSGSEVSYTYEAAQQIAHIANQDKHVVGAISWLASSRSHEALSVLSMAQFLQVSPQASNDDLSGISPYYFRIVPPNERQAQEATQFAEKVLHVKKLVVFLDTGDNDSQNLASDFEAQFVRDGYSLHEETFSTDKTKDFSLLIQNALNKYHPDAFYFTSDSGADTASFQDALPTSGPFANLPVISGNASYVARKNSYKRWFFTGFAYPDEWSIITRKINPPFFQDYISDFNPDGLKPAGYYGFTRPDDTVMLSYDATQVLLKGIQIALSDGKTTLSALTSQDVAAALPKITGAQAYQGVSGQIAFDANHDPINKAVVFLYTSADGHLQMKSYQGCFIKGCP
jgi:eukaryotic-like serine/threonine-protein kinase